MNKRRKKMLALIIAIAVMGYGFVGDGLLNTETVYAHADMEIQTADVDCDDGEQDCAQEHTEDCSNCVTSHNSCHSDYLLPPLYKFNLFNFHIKSNSLDNRNYSSLNYPPDVPPC